MKTLVASMIVLFALNTFAADGSAFKGKFTFLHKNTFASKCYPVGPKTVASFEEFESCGPFTGTGALAKATGQCKKADGMMSTIFDTSADCEAARTEQADASGNGN